LPTAALRCAARDGALLLLLLLLLLLMLTAG
jgi:hypothetical protein